MFCYELACRRCHWRTVCGLDECVARLRLIGLLRREPDPDDRLVAPLLMEAAPRMICPICKEKSLWAAPASTADDGDWQAAVLCDVCRAPIPPQRLEAVPGTKRCAQCQAKSESAEPVQDQAEYCPKCGALVELRVSRSTAITRYKRVCTGTPPCRL